MPNSIPRREWLKRTSLAALGLCFSLPGLAGPQDATNPPPVWPGLEGAKINLGSNENPYGISPMAREAILEMIPRANRYSFNIPYLENCRATIAAFHGVARENILLTAGSGEVLSLTGHYFYKPGANLVTADPTFFLLPSLAKKLGYSVKAVPVGADMGIDLSALAGAIDSNTSLVYLVNPNNPTGTLLRPAAIKGFCLEAANKTAILIDEAYLDFLDAPDNESMIATAAAHPNIMVTRTFSKIHGMAGLRMGYVISHPDRIRQLEDIYFNESQIAISNLTMAAALASLRDDQHRSQSRQNNAAARLYTQTSLEQLGIHCIGSHTNFMLFHLGDYPGNFAEFMLTKNIILRSNEYLGEKWCRVSMGTMEEMKQFITVMKQTWKQG